MTNRCKVEKGPLKIAIFGAGISGLAIAHQCVKQGFEVAIYDKEMSTGGKCRGTVIDGKVHELTHRQLFAKNHHLINFLKEIPSSTGSCLDSIYPQNRVQFHWGKKNKTMQFQRLYFKGIDKLLDDAKSAYSMMYSQVSLIDILWFKKQIQSDHNPSELLKKTVSEFFEYQTRPSLAAFLQPVLLGWIGCTDDTPALSVLDLLNNKIGEFHPDAPQAYSLGIREPIGDAIITPLTHYLREKGVQFYLGHELRALHSNNKKTRVDYVELKDNDPVKADFYVLALPAHVTQSLLGEVSKTLDYRYVFSHGFQFHFSSMPEILKDKTVGLVLDSAWGLSYHITTREEGNVCLSVTATDLDKAMGVMYLKPVFECNEEEVRDELLAQLFDELSLLDDPTYEGFYIGLGAKIVNKNEAETYYSDWFIGPPIRNEDGDRRYWIVQHALTQPTSQSQFPLVVEHYSNVFLSGEYLYDPKQKWRVPVTLERCIETANLCMEHLSIKASLLDTEVV